MKRPEISVQNHRAVYDYYESRRPNVLATKAALKVSGAIWWPEVKYQADAQLEIVDALKADTRLLLACNHLTMVDQFPVAAALQKDATFKSALGNMFIPAKAPHFEQKIAQRILSAMGAVPVFRPQDVAGSDEVFKDSTYSFIDMAIQKINAGQHMFIFPEGTRNKNDPSRLGTINGGIARIAMGVADDTPIAVVPVGLWYGDTPLQPSVVVGSPINGPFAKRNEVMTPLRAGLATCVQQAIAQYDGRVSEPQMLTAG